MKFRMVLATCLLAFGCGFSGAAAGLWVFHDSLVKQGPAGQPGPRGPQGVAGPVGPPGHSLSPGSAEDAVARATIDDLSRRIQALESQQGQLEALQNNCLPDVVTDVRVGYAGDLNVDKEPLCMLLQ